MVRNTRKLSNELVNQLKEFYYAGNSARQTAKKFGIGKTTVTDYVTVRPKNPLKLEEKRKRNLEAVKRRRKEIKRLSVEYKGGKCEKCGYDKCIGALEFHHIDPTKKDFGIAEKGRTMSWERTKLELDKCIMVCANCHREIHEELNKDGLP